MRQRNIFLSRWTALAWAAGIIWFAVEVSIPDTVAVGNNQQEMTDVTDSPVSNDQVKELEQTIANL